MAVFRIAVIGGDGIGPEVIDQAIRAAEAAARKHDGAELKWNRLPWSTAYYKQHGRMLPDDGWDNCKPHDAILFGAVGDPSVPDKITVHELLLPMRRKFDQYVNLRPAYLFAGVPCPLVGKKPGEIDMLVYRENTEGEYAPVGGQPVPRHRARDRGADRRLHAPRLRAHPARRLRRGPQAAAEEAHEHHQVERPGVRLGLWDEAFNAVRKDYPDVQSSSLLVDAAAMDFVRKPETFDVVVASNLFGDILTDLSAAVTGSIGLASSREHQPDAEVPEHVRAGPRQRAGHRRQGHRQSAGGDPVRGADARSPGTGEERDGRARRGSEGAGRGEGEDARPRRQEHDHGDGRRGRRGHRRVTRCSSS